MAVRLLPFILALAACSNASVQAPSSAPVVASSALEVVVVSERFTHDAPPGSDAEPRFRLAFQDAAGKTLPIEGEVHAHVAFRSGVALIEASPERPLLLVTPDGARRVLAQRAGAAPVVGEDGALYYAARYGLEVELHRLEAAGRDRILAGGLASAGVLAPRADGSLLFVGAHNGGVAGMWRATDAGAKCLTNCALRTGQDWAGKHVPAPGTQSELHAAYEALPSLEAEQPGALGGEP
jgi:hypothetical protein